MKRIFSLSLIAILIGVIGVCSCNAVLKTDASDLPVISEFSVKNKSGGVYIKWSELKNASGYKILRLDGEGNSVCLKDNYQKTSYTDTTALSGDSYTYSVIPLTADSEGVCKSQLTIVRLSQPEITEVKNTTEGVKVTWKKVAGADRYTLYRKGEGDSKWTSLGTIKTANARIDKAAESGKKYSYTVIARKGSYKSSYISKGVSVNVLTSPVIDSIYCTDNGIYLKWSEINGAESYVIYRRGAGGKWAPLAEQTADKTEFTDTTMTAGKTYAYTVMAKNSLAQSAYNGGKTYRFLPATNLSSVKNDSNGLKLSWKASEYASGYKIYRKSDNESKWSEVAVLKDKTKTSYTDTTVKNGKAYSYTLVAFCGKYQSAYNEEGKTNGFVSPPAAQFAAKSGTGYHVEWNKVKYATHYYVYRSESENGPWKKLARIGNVNSYDDKTAKKNSVYYYCIRAGIKGKYFSTYGTVVKTSTIDPNKKMVALTYDDGPHGTYTAQILDVLEKYDARATFFVVGSRIEYYPEQLTRAAELGCEIGSHTYSHINLPSYSDSAIKKEMNKTDTLIKKYTGEVAPVMRPPGGATSSRSLAAVGKPAIMWSVDTRDWDHRNASRTVSHIKNNVYDGAIVLMHDLYSPTAQATKTIVPWLIDNGYQLVTVSELMYYRGITMKSGGVYRSARP